MLRSKKDVDRHVRDILNKIKNEDERKVRGYNIARLYFNINEYESARRYLSEFLTVRPKAADAHRLLGQINEGLGNKEKAVQSYKTSYELGGGQKDLILKICELYTDVQCDNSVRLYWAEEGHRLYPHNESVVKLREALLTGSGTHSREELEKLYLDEIKANPTDVRLQTNLLQLYKDWGADDKNKLNEAYNYGCQVEARKPFSDSLEWYKTLHEIIQAYRSTTNISKEKDFHINYLSAMERLVYLTLASSSSTALLSQCTLTDAAALLHKFDLDLKTSLEVVDQNSSFGQMMIGQMYFHMALFILQNDKKDGLTHTSTTAGVLLLHACRFRPTESGMQSKSWSSRDQFWYKLTCHRLSQAAHILNHMAKTESEKNKFLNKVKQQCCNKEAQENIYLTLYGSSNKNKKEGSFFLSDDQFISKPLAYPEAEQVKTWDNVVGSMYCSSLRDMVWLCLQQAPASIKKPQPYYTYTLFEGLQFSTTNVNTGAPETLCHIDLLAFLAATVYCQIAASKENNGPPPASMPTVVASTVNTTEQAEWWSAAYTLFTNRAHHRLSKLRMVLQRGLEVIRAVGNHGVDLALMAHLAQCFSAWATAAKEDRSTASEVDALEDRAEHYWHRVLTLCQRAARNVINVTPRNRLFVVQNISLNADERTKVEEEGKYFLAMRLIQAGKQQEAIQALGELKSPEASFQRAMLYKEQAQALTGESGVEVLTADMRSQHTILLTQARDTLYLTLDRLRMPGVDRFHPLNTKLSQQLEDVERRLSHVTGDQETQLHREEDTESISDASQSPRPDLANGHVMNASQPPQMFSTPYRDNRNVSRILRQEARPSPERLDAQVRAITEVQENTLRNMEDTLRNMEEQNAALRAQNEALRETCATMAQEVKENASLFRSILEQNKSISQEAYSALLSEMKQVQTSLKDLQTQIHTVALDVGELRAMKAEAKHTEVVEAKPTEEQVAVDLPPAAVVPAGLYNSYMGYYSQQPVPSPLMPTPGLFGNPPFFPPSTLPDQTYSMPSSASQVTAVSSLSQTGSSVVTQALGSPAIVAKEPLPSPSGITVAQSLAATHMGSASWSVAQSISSTPGTTSSPQMKPAVTSAPHAFQITMPSVSAALTPPPASTPGEQLSISLPCSTTGLLANIPAPLYSAVTPDSSPQRGQSQVKSLSPYLSTSGLSPAANNLDAATASSGSQDCTITFIGNFKSPGGIPTSESPAAKTKDITDDDNECYVEDDHDPCPDFKPVVPLPEKVEVRTGEEDEEVLFQERAKLFRFLEKEWKERGTGVMKLLYNPGQGSVRVLMRRDQTHKICANHLVLSNIELQPMKGNDKVWIWAAQDYADEELRMEKFCCRFKTPEIATSFKEAFMKAKAIAKESDDKMEKQQNTGNTCQVSNQPPMPRSQVKSLAEMFKPAVGSWSCSVCLVNNTADATVCAACETPNPNAPKDEAPASPQTPFATFKFKSPSSTPGSVSAPLNASTTGITIATTTTSTPTTGCTDTDGKPSDDSTEVGFKLGLDNAKTSTPLASSSTPTSSTMSTTTTSADASKKFSLSGFTFTSAPTIKQEKVEVPEKPKEEEKKKESIFASFSFGSGANTGSGTSGFSFSVPSKEKSDGSSSLASQSSTSAGLFSNKSSGNLVSFSSLAANTSDSSSPSVFTIKDTKAFEPKALFGGTQAKSPTKDDGEDKVEEYEPQVDFQPVIPLPDLVEVKTGEEEEEKLFCERAKLFRFDKDTKEWKERGVGDLKILKNNTTKKVRVLMRREQIHKVCANHFLTPEIKLTQMQTSDKAWIWAAHDFADEEMKEEKFAARFKNQELALSFKTAFEDAQKTLESESSLPTSSVSTTTATSTPTSLAAMFKPAAGSWECDTCLVRNKAEDNTCVSCSSNKPGYEPPKESTPQFSFGISSGPLKESTKIDDKPKLNSLAMFKPAAGSWECNSCLVRNNAGDTVCAACGTGADGTAPDADSSVSKPAFSFGIKSEASSSGGFSFGVAENKATFSFGVPSISQSAASTSQSAISTPSKPLFSSGTTKPEDATDSSKPTFSFGIPGSVSIKPAQDTTAPSESTPTFSFGKPGEQSKPFNFAWSATSTSIGSASAGTSAFSQSKPSGSQEQPSTPTKEDKPGFVFGSPGKYEFSFTGVKARSPRSRDISQCESEDGVVEEDEGDHLYFEPVVPLPDKVDVITGEEEETVLYSHRAKLFRLVNGEWKERGLGDVKVLCHKKTDKIRLLMRREQVHKICLNHYLNKDMEFRKKDDKSLFWGAVDYTENEPQNETFAIRFKTPEIAAEFYKAVDDAKVKLGGSPTECPMTITSTPVKSEDANKEKTQDTPQNQSVSTPVIAEADTTSTEVTTKLSGSIFGGTPVKSDFGGSPGLFGGSTEPKGSLFEPSFVTNVSASFTLKGRDQQGILGAAGSPSVFGGSTTISTTPRSTFSFGDRFSSKQDSDDCEVVYIKSSSEEQKCQAKALMLPENFYSYTEHPSCPGCVGCEAASAADDNGGVEVVYEKKATPEQIEKARKLQLPDNFYLYEDAPPCPGCRGCREEESENVENCQHTALSASTPTGTSTSTSFSGTQPGPFTSSLFGKAASKSPSIFGTPKLESGSGILGTASSSPSIFGGSANPPTVFGGSANSPLVFGGSNTKSPVVFGGSKTPTFGGSATNSPSVFGGATTTSASIFGGSTSSSTSIFGGFSATSTASGSPSAFGTSFVTSSSNVFGGSTPTTTTSIFGSSGSAGSAGGLFGNVKASGSANLFGTASITSAENTASNNTTKSSTEGLFSLSNSSSMVSFGDLASQSNESGFGKKTTVESVWAPKDQLVFGKSPKKADEDDGEVENDHDPHFEPVVPLPDLVDVKTGEEDLEVVFSNRGKLYRYDSTSKQWKERGVGDFKILRDPTSNKFRLLQRREQVHKLCCNHYLTTQLQIRPMETSETAWCWYTKDFSESLEGTDEKLAIRFKTKDLADEFKKKFEECQDILRKSEDAINSVNTSATVVLKEPSSTQNDEEEEGDDDDDEYEDVEDEEDEDEDDDDDDDDDDEDEDDEEEDDDDDDDEEEDDGDDNVVIFSKRCTLSKKENGSWTTLGDGDLHIKYDDDFYGARITMTSESGNTLAEHIIAIQNTVHKEGNAATWTVLNLKPLPQGFITFKADFDNSQELDEFVAAFHEGKEYAENSGIMEQPSGEVAPEELYYGQGADEQGMKKEAMPSASHMELLENKSTLPFDFGQVLTCDPNLTRELVAALQEHFPNFNSELKKE